MADNFEEQKIKLTFDTNAKQAAGDTNALGASIDKVTESKKKNDEETAKALAVNRQLSEELRAQEKVLQQVVTAQGKSSSQATEQAKVVVDLKNKVNESKKSLDALKKSSEQSGGGGVLDQLKGGAEKLVPGLSGATSGMNTMLLKMWELVANPLGLVIAAIVVGLKFLYEAFQSSVAGGKELKAAWAGLEAVGTQVKDAVFGLGRALIDVTVAAYKFITLDFKGAAESMKKANDEASESYKQLGKAVDGTTAKLFYNLEKQQQANDKARKMQAVTRAETNKLLVESREILTDETASIKEKKKALEEVSKAEKASSAESVRIAKEDLRIKQEKAKALGGQAEIKMKGEIREATIALSEAETENAMNGIKLNKQRKMLLRQETADAKEAADAKKAAIKAQFEAEKEAARLKLEQIKKDAQELYKIDQQAKQDAADFEAYKKEEQEDKNKKEEEAAQTQTDILKATYDEQKALDLMAFNDKKTQKEALMSLGESALAGVKDLFGRNKKVQKGVVAVEGAIALGKLATNTVEAVGKDNATSPTTLGMPWSGIHIAQGAIGAASIISSTNKQLQALGGGSISGGGASSFGGGAAPQATPQVAFNNTAENQIGQSVNKAQAEQPPLKVYVAESDISNAQNNVKVLVTKNTI